MAARERERAVSFLGCAPETHTQTQRAPAGWNGNALIHHHPPTSFAVQALGRKKLLLCSVVLVVYGLPYSSGTEYCGGALLQPLSFLHKNKIITHRRNTRRSRTGRPSHHHLGMLHDLHGHPLNLITTTVSRIADTGNV
jgi:hypothetical protein